MSENRENTSILSQDAKKRIFLDTKEIFKNPLTDMGIYYKNDEDDLTLGYALIIGPKDTPYQYGYYLFQFKFPCNYPYSPPKVIFLTNDGFTRFNPNLYRNGKVCLSLLNTWNGPSWKPCQTIRSVLISILSNVFVNNPIENEPGFFKTSKESKPYNEIIRFKNIDFACVSLYLKNTKIKHKAYNVFYPIIKKHFEENYNNINKYLISSSEIFEENKKELIYSGFYNNNIKSMNFSLYKMNIQIDYEVVLNCLCDIKITHNS